MSVDWSTLSDGDLAALSLAGRQPAFAEILRRYRAPVFRVARAWTGEADEALLQGVGELHRSVPVEDDAASDAGGAVQHRPPQTVRGFALAPPDEEEDVDASPRGADDDQDSLP